MAASGVKIFDVSDVEPVSNTGGDVTNLQEAAEQGLFIDEATATS